MEEEKNVVIKPLPLPEVPEMEGLGKELGKEEMEKRLSRGKPGRKRKHPVRTNKRPMSEKQTEALARARAKRQENREKKKQSLKQKIEKQNQIVEQFEKGELFTQADIENAVHKRLGGLETILGDVNGQMAKLMSAGVFDGSAQTSQTELQPPTELRQADITKPQQSFVRETNGGASYHKTKPDKLNKATNFYQPQDMFF